MMTNNNTPDNQFVDYSRVIGIPLFAKIDWKRPTVSWLVMKYHGDVCTTTTKERVLKYYLSGDGYFFHSNLFVGKWENTCYHDTGALGLPSGLLRDDNGNLLATTMRTFYDNQMNKNIRTVHNLFSFVVGNKRYYFRLVDDLLFGFVKSQTRLCLFNDCDDLVIQTTKVGRYHEILLFSCPSFIEIIFPVFFANYYNLSWED